MSDKSDILSEEALEDQHESVTPNDDIAVNHISADEQSSETRIPRAAIRYKELSGADHNGRTKCDVFLRHYLHYSDGTTKDVEEIHVRKPIVYIFSAGGYINVFLDYCRRTDVDLDLAFKLVSRYMDPSNSVSYLPEEIQSGYYIDEEGNEELVYYPILELALSPIGHETEYMVHAYRPLLYALASPAPDKDLTVLHLVFKDNLFVIDEQVGDLDIARIQQEAMDEARLEMEEAMPASYFNG